MLGSLIYALVGFIELLLGLRFASLLIGANPLSPFVNWVYSWSGPFAAPFSGIFGQESAVTGQGVVTQSVIDWTTVIAMLVYGLVGALLGRVLARH